MATRVIRLNGDEILRQHSREVEKIDNRILTLIDDMIETMHNANGAGLAAPQVGVLKRIIVIRDGNSILKLINPQINSSSGSQTNEEACLSVPNLWGKVTRPKKVVVTALNPEMEKVEIKASGFLAKVLCHEIDHLNGILFIDKAEDISDY